MAEKINATCSICGKGYYKCLSCQSMMQSQPWKQYTDTSEHYKIFQVVRGFTTSMYTRDEAKERLQSIDLSDLNELRDNIQEIIKDILKDDKESFVVNDSVEQQVPVMEQVVEQPSYVGRKKKRYVSEQVNTDVAVDSE